MSGGTMEGHDGLAYFRAARELTDGLDGASVIDGCLAGLTDIKAEHEG